MVSTILHMSVEERKQIDDKRRAVAVAASPLVSRVFGMFGTPVAPRRLNMDEQ